MNKKKAEELMDSAERRWKELEYPWGFPFRSYAISVERVGDPEDENFRLRAYNKEGKQVSSLLTAINPDPLERLVSYPGY